MDALRLGLLINTFHVWNKLVLSAPVFFSYIPKKDCFCGFTRSQSLFNFARSKCICVKIFWIGRIGDICTTDSFLLAWLILNEAAKSILCVTQSVSMSFKRDWRRNHLLNDTRPQCRGGRLHRFGCHSALFSSKVASDGGPQTVNGVFLHAAPLFPPPQSYWLSPRAAGGFKE